MTDYRSVGKFLGACLTLGVWASLAACGSTGDDARREIGATVDESAIGATLYVSVRGSDDAPGSKGDPLRTVGEALGKADRLLKAGKGVRIRVGPGEYREGNLTVDARKWDDPARKALLILEGAGADRTIITGSDVWKDDWHAIGGGGGLAWHDWPHDWGFGPQPWYDWFRVLIGPEGSRRELLFVDGELYRPVLLGEWYWHDPDGTAGHPRKEGNVRGQWKLRGRRDPNTLPEGSFAVVEGDADSPGKLWVRFRRKHRTRRTKVEVSVRTRLLTVLGKDGLVLRGLRFRHAATFPGSRSGVFLDGDNLLIDSCAFSDNSGTGLSVGNEPRDVTLRKVRANRNGWKGITSSRPDGLVMEGCETSCNNWRGHLGATHGCDAAAVKIMGPGEDGGARVVGHVSYGNLAHGLWFDHCETKSAPVTIDRCLLLDNRFGAQLYLEKQAGPVTVTRSAVIALRTDMCVYGIGRRFTWRGNLLANFSARGRVLHFGHRKNSPYRWNTQWTMADNVLAVSDEPRSRVLQFEQSVETFREFVKTYRGSGNVWRRSREAEPVNQWGQGSWSLAKWQELTGQDKDTTAAKITFPRAARMDFAPGRARLRRRLRGVPLRLDETRRREHDAFLDRLAEWTRQQAAETHRAAPGADFAGATFTPADLSKLANAAVSGEGAVFRWTKLPIEPGERNVHGVAFRVPSVRVKGEDSPQPGGVALASKSCPEGLSGPLPGKVRIRIGRKADEVWLLHALAGSRTEKTRPVAAYRLVFEDGKTHDVPVVTLALRKDRRNTALAARANIADADAGRWSPLRTPDARPARLIDDPMRDPVRVYTLRIVNPRPGVKIERLEAASPGDEHPALVILGLTLVGR